MAKIDISSIKTQIIGNAKKYKTSISDNLKDTDSKLNKIGYSIITFIVLYDIFCKLYGYTYFNFTIGDYMIDMFILIGLSYMIGAYFLNKIFSIVFIVIAEQVINLINAFMRNK